MTIRNWKKEIARLGACATVVGALLIADGTAVAAPPSGPVTTDCRVKIHNAVLGPDSHVVASAHGAVNPGFTRPLGHGAVRIDLRDGGFATLHASTLLCRRDGGTVPEHGGANIADTTGRARLVRGDTVLDGNFQIHVEDRGTGREAEDYLAVRIADENGNQVLFDANYLASGNIELVPVSNNSTYKE